MPTYEGFDPQSIAPGGWDRFEQAYAATPLRRLMEEKATTQNKFMANMRKIGMADAPSAYKLWGETGEAPYANSMADLLSGAAAARYPLQLQEQTALNQMRQAQSQYGNEFAKWSWGAPRDWWRQRMGVFYGGQPTVTSQTKGTTNGIIPGLLGTGGVGPAAGGLAALLAASDKRVKNILHRFSRRVAGLYPVLFKYIWGGPAHIGFIAQEVEQLYPEAVFSINGIKHVNYAAIPLRR